MKKKITYLGHYDLLRNGEQERVYSLAGARKIDFICDELVHLGFDVDLVSAAYSNQKGHGIVPGTREKIREGITLILAPSNKATNKFARIKRVLGARFWLFLYLLQNCGKDDCVVVYHNYIDAVAIVLAQKIKGFKLILQIEEKYSMVWKLSPFQNWKENLLLAYSKKGSLVVSELLAERLNISEPIVSYGSYKSYMGNVPEKFRNNQITLVFTGMIESVRNGAFYSMECMRYLPQNYRLFLSGPVSKEDRERFEETRNKVNADCGRDACVYLGVLDDDKYEELLLNADIALNPQKEGGFGEFVFPSKILTYMSYNLPVVSTRGRSIVESKLAQYITFAEDFTPASVADAIKKVNVENNNDYRAVLTELEKEFQSQLWRRIES